MGELERLHSRIRKCRKCRLWKGRKRAVPGEGPADAGLFLLGEAPGRREDESGRPFVGRAGKLLDMLLEKSGLEREETFITSVVKCRPPGNRNPKRDEMAACRPYLEEQLALVKPKLVVLMGNVAASAFFTPEEIKEFRGKLVEKEGLGIFFTYHPAAGLRFPKIRRKMERDFGEIARLSR